MFVKQTPGTADYHFDATNNALLTVTNSLYITSDGTTPNPVFMYDNFRVNAANLTIDSTSTLSMNTGAQVTTTGYVLIDGAALDLRNTTSGSVTFLTAPHFGCDQRRQHYGQWRNVDERRNQPIRVRCGDHADRQQHTHAWR